MKKNNYYWSLTKQLTWIYFVILFFEGNCIAQIGGQDVYSFLLNSPSARVTALGGNLITIQDKDVNQGFSNPAAINSEMHGAVGLNHQFLIAQTNQGSVAYAHNVPKWWNLTIRGQLTYVGYGDFEARDERGNYLNDFKAKEYAFTLGAGKKIYEKLCIGANVRIISSQLESYSSLGFTSDLGAIYRDTSNKLTVALVFRNIGSQLTAYVNKKYEGIPYQSQIGISKRLKHLPMRFSIIYQYLNRWDIRYDDPDSEQESIILGDESIGDSKLDVFFDRLGRHFIINTEFLLGKNENFNIRAGYNHLRNRELRVSNFKGLSGFSLGFGIRIRRFKLDYGYGFYHQAAGNNHFSITTQLLDYTNPKIIQ